MATPDQHQTEVNKMQMHTFEICWKDKDGILNHSVRAECEYLELLAISNAIREMLDQMIVLPGDTITVSEVKP